MLRFILDGARNAVMNMAIDEILFDGLKEGAVLRLYSWDNSYTTIGYFQKNDSNAVRRLTGGLLVNHKDDLSYSFCADAQSWPYVYSQSDTYKHLHTAVKNALASINIVSSFAVTNNSCHAGESRHPFLNVDTGFRRYDNHESLCVQTLYNDDLMCGGKKVVGSCMRRRGKKILLQGSIHINFDAAKMKKFSAKFSENLAAAMSANIEEEKLTDSQLLNASGLAASKYMSAEWNKKY